MLFPAYYPLPAPPREVAPLPPAHQQRPRLAPACWSESAARAEHESLRALALAYGVSQETVRTIVQRIRYSIRLSLPAAD